MPATCFPYDEAESVAGMARSYRGEMRRNAIAYNGRSFEVARGLSSNG